MVKYRAVAVAVAVAVSGGGAVAVAVAVAGLTKRFFNHIQQDFLINNLNQDVRISIFNVIRTKMLGYAPCPPCPKPMVHEQLEPN